MYFVLAPYNSGSSAAQGAGFGGTALPAGWDASIRGMCVGERRVISLPASLAFGKDGLSLKKTLGTGTAAEGTGTGIRASIPPNTPIVIDVRLLSLNGVA
jgi:FKBP-type peptidyl-prolyl cis-trans isomerase